MAGRIDAARGDDGTDTADEDRWTK